jgi:hypothetical protein
MIRLFELEGKVIKPSEHCYNIRWLKSIMDNWPEDYIKIYSYLFYMTYRGNENPYFHIPEEARQDTILKDLELDFDIAEEEQIIEALNKTAKMYETPTIRAYNAIQKLLDNLSDYMADTQITAGRDGNINSLIRAAEKYDAIRQSFKGVAKDLEAEQEAHVRGGKKLGYDQM